MLNDQQSETDLDSSSVKALNAIFQSYVNNRKSSQKMKIASNWHMTDLDELKKSEAERDKKIKQLERYSSETSSIHDVTDLKIENLIQLIMELKSEIRKFKPSSPRKTEEMKILLQNDILEFTIREWKMKIETLEMRFDMLKKAHKSVVESLSQFHLKNEYQDLIDRIREDLRNSNNDYNEARSLLKELHKIAWAMLPPKIAKVCEEIENKMENVKFKWEELQISSFKKKIAISKMQKEMIALNSAYKGELRILELYEKKVESTRETARLLKIKLESLCSATSNYQKKLSWSNKILSNKASFSRRIPPISKVSTEASKESDDPGKIVRLSIVKNEEKAGFLQEKLVELEKEIITAKNDLETQKHSFEIVKANRTENEELLAEVKRSLQEKKLMATRLQQEVILRKTYYNQIEDLKGKIRVFCRCRPISQDEINRGNKMCVSFPDVYTITVIGTTRDKNGKEFQFDKVFIPNTLQETIFNDTSKLLQSAFDGFNVCIFAYGQTGSGKTFTLIGNIDNDPGIVPRAFDKIFEIANEGKVKFKTQVQCYMLELYNEKLLDLMTTGAVYSDKLEIKKDAHGMVIVPGAAMSEAESAKELKDLFLKGNSNRHIASTKMNSESSRSHLIISMLLTCFITNSENIVRGKISIIDLAGSERVSKSGVQGVGVQEAMSINMSLSALGDVISALTTGQAFIPYRNNKLTMLMQDSIGGNAKTLMFVNISPVDYNVVETVSSLTYGSRVKLIKNEANKVADVDEIPKLQKIIESLQKGEDVTF